MAISTPNMNLGQPTINIDSGLIWEQTTNNNAAIVDSHNHSPGQGVQLGADGINLAGDLTFNNNSIINLKAVVYTQQTSFASLNSIYVKTDGNLYFNDGASNAIQITTGGTVNATSSGISSGSATASFVSSVLVVNAAAATPANIQVGSILIGNNVPSSKFLTLAPPSAMAANYSITLPALPLATNIVTMDTSGNLAAVTNVDNSTLQLSSNVLAVKVQGITQGLLALKPTGTSVAAGGVAISTAVGVYSNSTTTYTTIATVTIVSTGRPVAIQLIPSGAGGADVHVSGTGTQSLGGLQLTGTVSSPTVFQFGVVTGSSGNCISFITPAAVYFMDFPTAGSHTYTLQGKVTVSFPGLLSVSNVALVAYEI